MCKPPQAESVERCGVCAGERPAAMQTGSAGLSDSWRCVLALLLASALHARLRAALLAS